MKRIWFILALCFALPVLSDSSVENVQLCFNTPQNTFGKTHFIVGYEPSAQVSVSHHQSSIIVNDKPFIIDGSSVHLIDTSRHTQSFFTTVHDIASIILKMLEEAEKSITLAAYSLTDKRIADALIAAHKRGIHVCVIVDGGKKQERYSKAQKLVNSGISVWCYDCALRPNYKKKEWSEPLMHHKCFVIDDAVITGSANATKAAQFDNIENINILRDPHAVEEHRQEFTRLKKFCKECKK